ncbi:DUF4391 domain-containing protein [Xanthomonas citri pv. phaseoli var. fuscans]|uniref:DUF4391 domain-containing protein n=1 Tax=Xanthomonas citri TaxID=346 RepID=UPI0018F2654F|nr:DUF4391 domain-containing protein [Xanthomonas citri]ATS51872.2 DUF4391 domain-containing protein [Xanthomonas citri pv. phaseoli var. fuscans]ATS80379.2 DUF4391 domain-containing protein [Xanthomonas citri pv. phaseoli var. fuscans]
MNKPVFKKLFLENGVLDIADKTSLKDDIDKIRWLYTLKPGTINVAAYVDSERDFSEIAVLQVELTSDKRLKRIATFIQRSIPYPLILLFTQENQVCLSVSDKRINQADKEKWVIEDPLYTDWIDLAAPTAAQAAFLEDCTINSFSFVNFLSFYISLSERVIAINCAAHSGRYERNVTENIENKPNESRLERLRELEKLNLQKTEIANKLKKEMQMGRQVELNVKIKQINDAIEKIRESI